jgi:phosphatidylserine decarboxylase
MLHKEGGPSIIITFVFGLLISLLSMRFIPAWHWIVILFALIMLILVIQFFRNPQRTIPEIDDNYIYAPADGKVVVIEETEETEFLKDKRIQISIFMSPLNVHVNRIPFAGKIDYFKYHPGKFLVAWHPKSSIENERSTTVIGGKNGQVLMRQIAGAVARRIKWYIKQGQNVSQGEEMGFIKFGSRVDLFLPLDAKINVAIDDNVKGNKTIIAKFK